MFSKLTSLRYLDLSNNKIEVISKGAFKYVTKLHELNLESNLLKTITNDLSTFSNLKELNILNLAINNFSDIPLYNQKINNFNTMKLLNLSGNQFDKLEVSYSFKSFSCIIL